MAERHDDDRPPRKWTGREIADMVGPIGKRKRDAVKKLKANDLRAWRKVSDNTIHIGEHVLDPDHARRIAYDILELLAAEEPPSADAVDPGAADSGTPATRVNSSSS